ncbi:hypothetical protein FJ930_28860 [Mesorhizobium sp. B2-4-15]|uniref:hypothetical protein n=1 Tax=Mesorhizobium sp. B2-4-15 TaxID=2589934 RepID=UPI0011542E41|nr:hypothetical protein [Mesorhizobium sp. B2-4-15]TPK59949.1 hypothetical protein FJ930_28860 [Mesorhizobium sp. B2-4-15]
MQLTLIEADAAFGLEQNSVLLVGYPGAYGWPIFDVHRKGPYQIQLDADALSTQLQLKMPDALEVAKEQALIVKTTTIYVRLDGGVKWQSEWGELKKR